MMSARLLVLLLTTVSAFEDLPWWRTAVFYQVYPRSFKDSDGDGVGDLKGIMEKAEYFKKIGVTAIWINPVNKSPMKDFGYDISDFRSIDPIYGTIDDFKQMIKKLHQVGVKLVVDMVPNHCSDQHEWFQKSVKRIDPYTDYFVWHDGKKNDFTGEREPPNNWVSVMGGGAWEYNKERQQYYLHQFLVSQPDLNYRNEHLRQEMEDVLKYWLDIGVDGFRVDSVAYAYEHEDLKDEPEYEVHDAYSESLNLTHTHNLQESYGLVRDWANIVHNYTLHDGKDRAMFVEVYEDIEHTMQYYGEGKLSLMQPFNFNLLRYGNWSVNAKDMRRIIMSWMDAMPKNCTPNWVVGNHDNDRIANRYGTEMVDAVNMLTGCLPGVMGVYYGEELGMENSQVRWEDSVDTKGTQLGKYLYTTLSRDGERSPMQWDDSLSAGFSSNSSTWLPVHPNYWRLNVAAQLDSLDSHLNVFTDITEVRTDPVMLRGDLDVQAPDEDTLVIIRSYEGSSYQLIVNMGKTVTTYKLDSTMQVAVSSLNARDLVKDRDKLSEVMLRPKAAVLLKSV